MITIGAFEAKTHLPNLLKKVRQGENIIITKHGYPVAKLAPLEKKSTDDIKEKIKQLIDFRQGKRLGNLKIREMINEGRRF